jgi:hypothetical protein
MTMHVQFEMGGISMLELTNGIEHGMAEEVGMWISMVN